MIVGVPERDGPKGRRGFTQQAESPNVHLRVPAFKNTTKFQREDPQREREKERKWGREREKKARNFGRSGGGGSGGGGPGKGVRRRGCPVEEMKKINKSKHLKNNFTMCRSTKKRKKDENEKKKNQKKKKSV